MTTLVINNSETHGFTASDKDIAKCASKAATMVGKARTFANDARILGVIALLGETDAVIDLDGVKLFSSKAQRTNFTYGLLATLMGPTKTPIAAVDTALTELVINNGRLVESTKCDLGRKVRDETGLKILRAALGHCKPNAANVRHLTAALAEVGAETLTAENFAAVKSAFNASVNTKKTPTAKTKSAQAVTLEQVLAFMADPSNARLFVTNNGLNHIAAAYTQTTGEHSMPALGAAMQSAHDEAIKAAANG